MHGIDLIRLKADTQVVVNYLDNAVELAGDDVTRAFAAVEEAKKRLQQIYANLHYEHILTIRRG